MEGEILPGGGRGMTASEVWGMRPQNGDSQHGVPSLNIGSATNCNGRLVYVSEHVGDITNISSYMPRVQGLRATQENE